MEGRKISTGRNKFWEFKRGGMKEGEMFFRYSLVIFEEVEESILIYLKELPAVKLPL